MGVSLEQDHGPQARALPLLWGAPQNETTAPHGSFRHQASCCHPLRRWARAQALAQQPAAQQLAAVRSHRGDAYDLMQEAIQPAQVVQPGPSNPLLRPSANRSCRRPSGLRIRNPLQVVDHPQSVDQDACRRRHPPVGDRFQATDRSADHQHPDRAAPGCAASVENVHPSLDLNDAAAAANAPFANQLMQSTPHQLQGPKETNPSQS